MIVLPITPHMGSLNQAFNQNLKSDRQSVLYGLFKLAIHKATHEK